jgi:hypothetical protein
MTEMIRWEPTKFEAQAGAFSSTKRYIRKAASGGYGLASGATVTGLWVSSGGNTGVSFRFRVPGYMDVQYQYLGSFSAATPAPTVQAVEI